MCRDCTKGTDAWVFRLSNQCRLHDEQLPQFPFCPPLREPTELRDLTIASCWTLWHRLHHLLQCWICCVNCLLTRNLARKPVFQPGYLDEPSPRLPRGREPPSTNAAALLCSIIRHQQKAKAKDPVVRERYQTAPSEAFQLSHPDGMVQLMHHRTTTISAACCACLVGTINALIFSLIYKGLALTTAKSLLIFYSAVNTIVDHIPEFMLDRAGEWIVILVACSIWGLIPALSQYSRYKPEFELMVSHVRLLATWVQFPAARNSKQPSLFQPPRPIQRDCRDRKRGLMDNISL